MRPEDVTDRDVRQLAATLVASAPTPGVVLTRGGDDPSSVSVVATGPAVAALTGGPLPAEVMSVAGDLWRSGGASAVVRPRSPDGTLTAALRVRVVPVSDVVAVCWLLPEPEPDAARATVRDLDLDPVTGLPSARAARGLVARASALARESARPYSVVRVDVVPAGGGPLDAADAVETARRLQDLVRSDDAIARAAGGGFVLVLQWQVDDPAVRSFSDRVSAALDRPLGDGRRPDLRVGVLATPDPGLDPDAVLAGVDALVSGAAAGGPVVLATGTGTTHPGITVASVDEALTSGQLRLCYQPVVDVQSGRAAGAEALVRWEHPDLGRLAPAQFLPAVDAAGALVRLGEWVLEEAVRQVSRWQSVADLDYYRVGINLAPMHLETVDVAGHVRLLLDRYAVPADRFIVELVESEALTERALVARRVRELIDLGLRVAIDDFGSGFANMSYLRDLPVDVIKVDRALVGARPTRRDEAILRAVAAVAAAVGADVLLEGIETSEQLELARRVGVRFGQGMLLGPPVPPGPTPPRPRIPD